MYSTLQGAKRIGIAKNTLLRWISLGLIEEVDRDWRGWRVWSEEDILEPVLRCSENILMAVEEQK